MATKMEMAREMEMGKEMEMEIGREINMVVYGERGRRRYTVAEGMEIER
jgi:hypothetical protein